MCFSFGTSLYEIFNNVVALLCFYKYASTGVALVVLSCVGSVLARFIHFFSPFFSLVWIVPPDVSPVVASPHFRSIRPNVYILSSVVSRQKYKPHVILCHFICYQMHKKNVKTALIYPCD